MRNWLFYIFFFAIIFNFAYFSPVKPFLSMTRASRFSTGFLIKRTIAIDQKVCSCPTAFSCACCQSVTILLQGVAKNLCANFTYGQTGLSMSIMLGSNIIRQVSIIEYQTLKVCTSIPNCFHSSACVHVTELSRFPRSITICIQLDISSKTDNWIINYNCISVSTLLSNQNQTGIPGTTGPPGQMPTGQMTTQTPGQMPGQIPGQTPGQMTGQMPAGQTPGQMPAGQTPGQMPAAQTPGQMPAGQMPAAQTPGQIPAGQTPGQMPAAQTPGQMSAGQMPAAQTPGQMPAAQTPGQMPAGQMPAGQMPAGQMTPGQMPPGQMPPGQMPPSQMPAMISGSKIPALKRRREVRGFIDWVTSKKLRKMRSAVQIIRNSSDDQELKRDRNIRAINISPKSDHILKDLTPLDQKFLSDYFLTKIKIEFGNSINNESERLISSNNLSVRSNHRLKRNIQERINSPMKMQVILRSRKTRLPHINNRIKDLKNYKNNLRASRSSGIVNQGTISIPMSDLGSGNVIIQSPGSPNNALTPPQRIPASPSVFALENTPPIEKPIIPEFSINYDNRTSSFPNRMPPSFGINSRIGPIDVDKSVQFFIDRSVEELETVGPKVELNPNSKIIEITTTNDFSDGRIIFPE